MYECDFCLRTRRVREISLLISIVVRASFFWGRFYALNVFTLMMMMASVKLSLYLQPSTFCRANEPPQYFFSLARDTLLPLTVESPKVYQWALLQTKQFKNLTTKLF